MSVIIEGDGFVKPWQGGCFVIRIVEKKAAELYAYEWWYPDGKQWVRQKHSLVGVGELARGWERINNRLEALVKWGAYGINHYSEEKDE